MIVRIIFFLFTFALSTVSHAQNFNGVFGSNGGAIRFTNFTKVPVTVGFIGSFCLGTCVTGKVAPDWYHEHTYSWGTLDTSLRLKYWNSKGKFIDYKLDVIT